MQSLYRRRASDAVTLVGTHLALRRRGGNDDDATDNPNGDQVLGVGRDHGALDIRVRRKRPDIRRWTERSFRALERRRSQHHRTAADDAAAAGALPTRYCPSGDCTREPLALWTFDDCNTVSTQLADTAFTYPISHPAFRAVSVACTDGMDNQGVKLSGGDDIVYAPDQVDFAFDKGLTVAAWIKPDSIGGTQSLVRKRLDGSSSFLLAIDGKKLVFALRLTNGRAVNVSASIMEKRFTHVAATYDGKDAILYLDGAVAAQTHVTGTIAPGAGPIFVGNDANGRQFKGIVDTVWLNTLAAPADVVRGFLCVRKPPIVSLTPGATPPQVSGTTVAFDSQRDERERFLLSGGYVRVLLERVLPADVQRLFR